MGISEADMDKHCYPNTMKQVLEYTFIVMPIIMDHYKGIYMNIDLLFVNKIPILLMISRNTGFMHFKALLSKHNKHVQNGLQQIVQSRRFKAVYIFVDRVFENIVDKVQSNLHLDITNWTVDSHMSIPEDVIQVVNVMEK